MWDSSIWRPQGSISLRRMFAFATALIVACFVYLVANAPLAHAVDASWESSKITYKKNVYNGPVTVEKDGQPEGTQKDGTYYTYVADSGSNGQSPKKAYVIYFAPGNDPGTVKTARYAEYTYTGGDRLVDPVNTADITIDPSGYSAPSNPGTSSCVVEGIGWIVCPVTKALASSMDYIYSLVDGFLEVRPLITTEDQALYRAWSFMRNIANLAFVIGFLVVIYSQLSNFGMSSYGMKKILPRIAIAAILVNISYWICAIAVDIFNILGYSIQDLFIAMRNSLVGSEGNTWDVISWESLSSFILAGGTGVAAASIGGFIAITSVTAVTAGTVGVAAVTGLALLLLPILLSMLFVILMTFLILAARQAIITVLIIIAPLAFVAYLLPNTEKWFEKWRSALFTLLLVFPAFSVVFGGAQLASAVIIQNATSINIIILGMAVQVAPLMITPLLLKLGGGILNRFAGIVNNPTKGVFDRGKNWAKDRTEQNKARGHAALAERAKRNGFVAGRPANPTRRSRFNPANMAYRREYNRRRREGMKAANESVTDGLFAQTAAANDIYFRSQRGDFEKHFGEENSKEAWTKHVYGDPTAPRGSTARAGDSYLHGLHEATHMAEGRAKTIEEAANAHTERRLQEYIRDTKGYKDLRVQTAVESGLADSAKKIVDAQGSLALKKAIEQNPYLTNQAIQTVRFEKQAAEYETVVQKAAEAAYDTYSRTNAGAQQLRLRAVEQTDQAKLAEQQWNTLIENIKAEGYTTQGVANANTVTADNIRTLHNNIEIQGRAADQAKVVQAKNLTDIFINDVQQREVAGGIRGDDGAESVLAAAVAQSRKEYGERIAEKTQLSRHFNLSASQRFELAMGHNATGTRDDGTSYEFKASDEYARESAIEDVLKAGSFSEKEKLIESTGVGGINHNFRTTVREAIVTNGLPNSALYWGSKIIDDVGQGLYDGTKKNDAILFHLAGGKIKPSVLATQSAAAAQSLFEVINDTAAINARSPEDQANIRKYYQQLKYDAWKIMHDDQLQSTAEGATQTVLKDFMEEPPESS